MSPGNLTFYFPTKEHLLAELVEALCSFQWKMMEEEANEGYSSVIAICLEQTSVYWNEADGTDPNSRCSEGTTSLLVSNILRARLKDSSNENRANMLIFARAYVELADGSYLYSEVFSTSLRQVAQAADAQWATLDSAQKTAFTAMYQKFLPVIENWNLPNTKEN